MNSALPQILIAFLGGLLCWLAWPTLPFFPLIFVAFIPLLLLEAAVSTSELKNKKRRLFYLSYIFFFTFNILTTWWVKNASLGGAVVAFTLNALFMCLPILLFHSTKKRFGNSAGYLSLIVFWLSFEYLHQNWELTWPWLTLGNVFAQFPQLVQWYEYTGTSGGTLWIWLVNISVFVAIKNATKTLPTVFNIGVIIQFFTKHLWKPALLLIVPLLVSVYLFNTYEEKGEPVDVVVLQPNIDAYEKFDPSQKYEHMAKFISLSKSKLDHEVDYLVWPETSLPQVIWKHEMESNYCIRETRKLIETYPSLTLITGATTLQLYNGGKPSSTARPVGDGSNDYFDAYNAALELNTKNFEIEHYAKSKLVPGVERMPYPSLFRFLDNFAIDLGGIAGSLGTQPERSVFFNDKGIGVAPVICYESVFAEYVTEYINKGAGLIFIITNDAWWGNTQGHKQHVKYASLRAIENRRANARSANTGISCFINQKGEIEKGTLYNEDAVIRKTILANTDLTFFTVYGDMISRVSLGIALFLLFNLIVSKYTNSFKFAGVKRKA